jgi:serine/threonine protein kinase
MYIIFTHTRNKKLIWSNSILIIIDLITSITFKHKYSEEIVVRILRQLLDAVQWLHLHGFVHLNIHPLTVLNANLTQVNIKLGGLENAVPLSELVEQNFDTACASAQHRVLQPIEFSGKF